MFSLKKTLHALFAITMVVETSACGGENEKAAEVIEKPIVVTLSQPLVGEQSAILATGQVEAARTANISTKIIGRITHILVKVGDKVTKGQVLARVWDEDIKAKRAQADAMIREAEGAYATARKNFDRFDNLYKQQSATSKELEEVTLQYNSAKARLSALREAKNEVTVTLSYGSLIAPFAGVVTQKLAEEGNIIGPGLPIFTIEQSGNLQVSATIAESDISKVHVGDTASIFIKSTGKSIRGGISQINPSSQFTGGQFNVKLSIPSTTTKDIYSGMYAAVTIPVKNTTPTNSNKTLVPLSAIIYRDELTGIFTVSANHTALLRWIRLGKIYGDKVEVISGLSGDEKYIISAESRLYNGAPVTTESIATTGK